MSNALLIRAVDDLRAALVDLNAIVEGLRPHGKDDMHTHVRASLDASRSKLVTLSIRTPINDATFPGVPWLRD